MRYPFKTLATLLLLAAAGLGGCKDDILSKTESTQTGYRGTGMVQLQKASTAAALREINVAPPAEDPAEPTQTMATQTYKNVQVLTDLNENEFNRLMISITNWVAPEQGCNYCHNVENMADDALYTKKVARRMLQMTRHINKDWGKHVGNVGVTCYTCHRGNPVPANVWHTDTGPMQALGMAADRQGQNLASASVGYTSLPFDPFSTLLNDPSGIRVQSQDALTSDYKPGTKQTEITYGLMIHLSQALGVNCTFCHNSRAFESWEQSTFQRITAWHGLRMVPDVNKDYVAPLTAILPPNRLGPHGDGPMVNCATCHQGVNKPLYGAQMVKDYFKELSGPGGAGDPTKN